MRLYTFNNYYLSSLQQGLQGSHALAEMLAFYDPKTKEFAMLREWATKHKTITMLNGGNSKDIDGLYKLFSSMKQEGMLFPFARFKEDRASLGGATTSVAIVVDDDVVRMAAAHRQGSPIVAPMPWSWKERLVLTISAGRLAS